MLSRRRRRAWHVKRRDDLAAALAGLHSAAEAELMRRIDALERECETLRCQHANDREYRRMLEQD